MPAPQPLQRALPSLLWRLRDFSLLELDMDNFPENRSFSRIVGCEDENQFVGLVSYRRYGALSTEARLAARPPNRLHVLISKVESGIHRVQACWSFLRGRRAR